MRRPKAKIRHVKMSSRDSDIRSFFDKHSLSNADARGQATETTETTETNIDIDENIEMGLDSNLRAGSVRKSKKASYSALNKVTKTKKVQHTLNGTVAGRVDEGTKTCAALSASCHLFFCFVHFLLLFSLFQLVNLPLLVSTAVVCTSAG